MLEELEKLIKFIQTEYIQIITPFEKGGLTLSPIRANY